MSRRSVRRTRPDTAAPLARALAAILALHVAVLAATAHAPPPTVGLAGSSDRAPDRALLAPLVAPGVGLHDRRSPETDQDDRHAGIEGESRLEASRRLTRPGTALAVGCLDDRAPILRPRAPPA